MGTLGTQSRAHRPGCHRTVLCWWGWMQMGAGVVGLHVNKAFNSLEASFGDPLGTWRKKQSGRTGVSAASVQPCDAPSSGTLAKLRRALAFVSALFPVEVLLLPRAVHSRGFPEGMLTAWFMWKMGSSLWAPTGRVIQEGSQREMGLLPPRLYSLPSRAGLGPTR